MRYPCSLLERRRGICPFFYTSKIPNFFNFTRGKRVNGVICVKNLEWRLFYSYISTDCQFFLLKDKLTLVIMWKATTSLAWIRQIIPTRYVLILNKSKPSPKIFYTNQDRDFRDKCHVCWKMLLCKFAKGRIVSDIYLINPNMCRKLLLPLQFCGSITRLSSEGFSFMRKACYITSPIPGKARLTKSESQLKAFGSLTILAKMLKRVLFKERITFKVGHYLRNLFPSWVEKSQYFLPTVSLNSLQSLQVFFFEKMRMRTVV